MSDQAQGPGWWQASDGRWYPPQAPPPQQVIVQKSNAGKIIGILALVFCVLPFVAVVAIIALGSTVSDETSTGAADEVDDAEVTDCGVDEIGWMFAEVTVTNNSSKASTYSIEVVFENNDGTTQLGDGLVFVDNLQPGQNVIDTASALEGPPDGVTPSCRLASVDRMAAN